MGVGVSRIGLASEHVTTLGGGETRRGPGILESLAAGLAQVNLLAPPSDNVNRQGEQPTQNSGINGQMHLAVIERHGVAPYRTTVLIGPCVRDFSSYFEKNCRVNCKVLTVLT